MVELFSLAFIGQPAHDLLGGKVSLEAAELILVFGTIAISMAIMVWLGNWWSR